MFNEAGQPVYSQNFDAWGRERNPQTWDYTSNSTTKPEWLIRGYTGHEMLPEFGLINMNGRMYDPVLGRMLSPDNFVQDPSSTQSFNRYSYCWNNPLKYTDPSGDIVWAPIIIGAVVGTYIGGSIANDDFNPVNWDYNSASTYIGMGIGMVAGAVGGHYIGAGIKAGTISGAKLAANSYAGTINSIYNYNSDQGVLGTLGYFAAGYFGSAIGVEIKSQTASMVFGGFFNIGAGIATGNIDNGYSMAQHFIGGALSAYAGYSFHGSISGVAKAKGYRFGKYDDKFLSYGLQANAADFAYDKDQKFFQKGFGHHFGTFFMGGLGGVMQSKAMDNSWVKMSESKAGKISKRLTLGITAYGIEYISSSNIKSNFHGLYHSGWEKKVVLSSYKSLMHSLILR